jgi:hypothetical protein
MQLKRLISQFTYRIEPKPEGGFIARATDPTVPPLEAATREEVNQKIQANITAALAAEFPGVKLPNQNQGRSFTFHIEHNPKGGFAIHSSDPNAPSIEGATHQEIESRFAEKLFTVFGTHLAPELAQALAAQGNSGDIKVTVNRSSSVSIKAGSHTPSFGAAPDSISSASPENTKIADETFASLAAMDNSPITPQAGKASPILRLLLGLLIVFALLYFFRHYR